MRVDHYTATLDGEDGAEVLAWAVEALPVEVELGRDGSVKRYNYGHAIPLLAGRDVVAVVRWGGNGGGVSVELKGSIAHQTYGLLRSRWPDHSCSRLDVAVDGTSPGLFGRMWDRMLTLRDELPVNRRPKLHQVGDWTTPNGRTAYVGSQEAGCRVVLYEKGYEREARGCETEPDLNWTRLELRVTPQRRDQKRRLAQLLPLECWGWSGWASAYLEAFNGLRPDPVELPRRKPDDERAYAALLAQYGSLLDRLAAGDWSGLGETLGRDLGALQGLRSAVGRR